VVRVRGEVLAQLPQRKATYSARASGRRREGDNLLARSLKPLMVKAGLPRHNLHTLRRSNATSLVLLGINPRVAMRWMGHSDVATTLKFY
jgi:site-specific recombinase XerD